MALEEDSKSPTISSSCLLHPSQRQAVCSAANHSAWPWSTSARGLETRMRTPKSVGRSKPLFSLGIGSLGYLSQWRLTNKKRMEKNCPHKL